ncbi:MAG: lactate utilization protein [Bacilli bacterium]|nr:lactate utilization protein [Bacilli bacterium]
MEKIINLLNKRGFKAKYFLDKKSLSKYLTESLVSKKIGIGGSMSVKELNIVEELKERNTVLWHWLDDSLDSVKDAEVYLSGVNALSKTGEIVNIDRIGNRLSMMCYGPKKLILIVGKNKITKNLEEAIYRAKNIAAPLNAKRLNKKVTCVELESCVDCNSSERICSGLLILMRPMENMEVEVLIVDEKLGF